MARHRCDGWIVDFRCGLRERQQCAGKQALQDFEKYTCLLL